MSVPAIALARRLRPACASSTSDRSFWVQAIRAAAGGAALIAPGITTRLLASFAEDASSTSASGRSRFTLRAS
jgi:DNA-binding NarL/FixJ family response regulator